MSVEVEPVAMFHFTLTIEVADLGTDDVRRALFDAGCDDATVARVDSPQLVDFHREAACFADAVGSAIRAVESAVPGARVVEMWRDESTDRLDANRDLNARDVVASAGILSERDYPHWRDAESIQQWVRAVRRGGLPEQSST